MLLSLITSCSCTSNFFGKLGELFGKETEVDVDGDRDDYPEVVNKDLKFVTDSLVISLSDTKAKLGFTYTHISPKEFTCSTSDAEIATCYVVDDYVVINPYKAGNVKVTVQTTVNGKIYKAIADVTIEDIDRFVKLSSYGGTINLAFAKKRTVSYSLVGLSGDVKVTSSDDSIATATVKDGIMTITAKETGKVTLTVSVNYNGKEYTAEYNLNIINNPNAGSGNTKPGTDTGKDKESSLVSLTTNKGTLTPEFKSNILEYSIGVSWWTWHVTLNATATNSNIQNNIVYSYKRADKDNFESVKDLKNLSLKVGDNIVLITVTAEDGSKTVYKVTINRSNTDTLKELTTSVGSLSPEFDKDTLNYTIDVPEGTEYVTMGATPWSDKSEVTYTFNGETKSNLNDLHLVDGPNIVTITVSNKGTSRTYTVIINKPTSEDTSRLTSLVVDGTDQLNFNPFKKNYELGVDYSTSKVLLSASSTHPEAKISFTYGNNTVTGGNNVSFEVDNLEVGDNLVTVKVVNGDSESIYTVNINRASNPYTGEGSTELTDISVEGHDIGFNKDKTEYTVNIGKDTDITLSATGVDGTVISYRVNGGKDIVVSSGNKFTVSDLKGKNNQIVISAKDSDGNVRDYIINVERDEDEEDINLNLNRVLVDGSPIKKDSDASYSTTTSSSSVTLRAEPVDSGATVEYYFGGHKLDVKDDAVTVSGLANGLNQVTVKVSKNGSEPKIYTVSIVRGNVTPPSQDTSLNVLEATADGKTNAIVVGSTISFKDNIEIKAQNNSGAKITYYIGSSEYKTLSEFNKALNNMKPGETANVKLVVTAQAGNSEAYEFKVQRTGGEVIDEKPEISFDGTFLTPPGSKNYTTKVDSFNKTNVPVTVKYPNGYSLNEYVLNGTSIGTNLNSAKLVPGWNTLVIKVNNPNGTVDEYTVRIYRPERVLKFDNESYECYAEDDQCSIAYSVVEKTLADDNVTILSNPLGIENTDAYSGINISGITVSSHTPGAITFAPGKKGDVYNIEISKNEYDTGKTTVTMVISDYFLRAQNNFYKIKRNNKTSPITNVVLETSLFNVRQLDTKMQEIHTTSGELQVCSSRDSHGRYNCIKVKVIDDVDHVIGSLSFKPGNEANPTYIPIGITGSKPGNAKLEITGIVYDGKGGSEIISGGIVSLSVVDTYRVTLHAQGGLFYKDETQLEHYDIDLEIEKDTVLDLSQELAPQKLQDECNEYKFLGYSTSQAGTTVEYAKDAKITISKDLMDSTNTLELWALYESIPSKIDMQEVNKKVIVLKDINLFGETDEDKMIYPGANGYHSVKVKNNTNYRIYVYGMQIDETSTTCIDGVGCLPMGYILKATDPENESKAFHYLTGEPITNTFKQYSDKNYKVINPGYGLGSTGRIDFINDFADKVVADRFDADGEKVGKAIDIDPGEEKEIVIHWKWIELGDELDTAIGKHAANNPNRDLYGLNITLEYFIDKQECK